MRPSSDLYKTNIAKKYNVKSAVIDMRPYEEEFGNFRDAEPYRVFGAEYNPSYKQKTPIKVDEKAGIYTIHRNQAFDKSHAWFRNKMVEIPRKCAEVDEFARQMCNCAKVLEETEEGDLGGGSLFATGLVAGGALAGVIVALLSVNDNIFGMLQAISVEHFLTSIFGEEGYMIMGVIFFAVMGIVLYRVASKKQIKP